MNCLVLRTHDLRGRGEDGPRKGLASLIGQPPTHVNRYNNSLFSLIFTKNVLTPPMCIPVPKINLGRVELWYWRLRNPSGQSGPWRMARGRGTTVSCDDYKNLEFLYPAKRLNSRQARWATFLKRFNFHLCCRSGSKNLKPDAFSHLHSPDLPPKDLFFTVPRTYVIVAVQWEVEEKI